VGALARTFEGAGLTTVVVNMMPVWGARFGAPRTLGVEFPFGHPCGLPGDIALQTRVVRAALDLLASPGPPPVTVDFPELWPGDFEEWARVASQGAVADHPLGAGAGGGPRARTARGMTSHGRSVARFAPLRL